MLVLQHPLLDPGNFDLINDKYYIGTASGNSGGAPVIADVSPPQAISNAPLPACLQPA